MMKNNYPKRREIAKGKKVSIVEKKNQASGEETVGIVDEILTNSKKHPHGIKVKLKDGRVGRVKKILESTNPQD